MGTQVGAKQKQSSDRVALVIQILLGVAVYIAVLAFGGTTGVWFSLSQILIFGAAAIALVGGLTGRAPFWVPSIVGGLIIFQLLPLPESLLRGLIPSEGLVEEIRTGSLTVAPYDTSTMMLVYFTYVTALILVALSGKLRNGRKRIVYGLLFLGFFEAAYGLVQYLTGWQYIFGYEKTFFRDEATGTYINRSHFAGLLEMIIPFAGGIALAHASAFGNGLRRGVRGIVAAARTGDAHFQKTVLWGLLTGLMLLSLLLSKSRMGTVAGFFSLAIMVFIFWLFTREYRIGVLLLGGIVLIAFLFLVWVGIDPVAERFETLASSGATEALPRLTIWENSLSLIQRRPWFGSGLGSFSTIYTTVQNHHLDKVVHHAHNDYLEVAAELGIPAAMLLFGGILVLWTKAILRIRATANVMDSATLYGCVGSISAILLHSFTDFNLFIPANGLIFCVVLGITYLETIGPSPQQAVKGMRRTPAEM